MAIKFILLMGIVFALGCTSSFPDSAIENLKSNQSTSSSSQTSSTPPPIPGSTSTPAPSTSASPISTTPPATPNPTATPVPPTSGPVTIPTGTWVMVPTHGVPASAVGWEKLVYSSLTKKAVMLGNYHQFGSEPNEGMISYDFMANRWEVLDVGGNFHNENMPDGGHPTGTFDFDPNDKVYVYYCCSSGSMEPENPYHTWWFDPVGQVGRDKLPSSKPGRIMEGTATFDFIHNLFVMTGGATWAYDPSANSWSTKSPTGPQPNLAMSSMTFDTKDQKIYHFGGRTGYGTNDVFYNDLHTYDVATNTWTLITPNGPKPPPRQKAGFTYDSTNNIFLLFGGNNDSGLGISAPFNDTWIYDPATNQWTQLQPAQSPALAAGGVFERLTYDADHNVFIMVVGGGGGFADGPNFAYGIQTWMFRYKGTGPAAGTAPTNPQPTLGSINKNVDGWANEPVLASSGSNLLAAWVEIGQPFDQTNAAWPHVYANQYSAGKWTALGGSYTSINSEASGYSESHEPQIAYVAGKPWVSWYDENNSVGACGFCAKSWNGTSWTGGPIGHGSTTSTLAFDGRSQLADVGGVPTIAFVEIDKNFYPDKGFIYVKYWNGSQWTLKGAGPLNRYTNDANLTQVEDVSITSDGANPIVAWTEYLASSSWQSDMPPQVYVSQWNGSQWVALGGSLNISASGFAGSVSVAYLNSQPYVAWTERSAAGNEQLYVKTFSGGSWVSVTPGSLNRNGSASWAFRPRLIADGSTNSIYLGWVEQPATGQKAQTYVSKYTSGAWNNLGTSVNANASLGSSQRASLAVLNGQPVVAWGEVNTGAMRQIYVKQWNGSSWQTLP